MRTAVLQLCSAAQYFIRRTTFAAWRNALMNAALGGASCPAAVPELSTDALAA